MCIARLFTLQYTLPRCGYIRRCMALYSSRTSAKVFLFPTVFFSLIVKHFGGRNKRLECPSVEHEVWRGQALPGLCWWHTLLYGRRLLIWQHVDKSHTHTHSHHLRSESQQTQAVSIKCAFGKSTTLQTPLMDEVVSAQRSWIQPARQKGCEKHPGHIACLYCEGGTPTNPQQLLLQCLANLSISSSFVQIAWTYRVVTG